MGLYWLIYLMPVFLFSCSEKILAKNASSTIFYMDRPASSWFEAIPIGNGSLGGMVYGGVTQDTIRTNEDTFWSGEPRNVQRPGAYKALSEIRKLLLEDKTQEAQDLINSKMLGPFQQNYMPFVDILLEWLGGGKISNYRRELDLNRGVVTITYMQGGVRYKRELFASYPDQAIVMHVSANKEESISFTAGLDSQIRNHVRCEGEQIIINGVAPCHTDIHYVSSAPPIYREGKGIRFVGRLQVRKQDGTIQKLDNKLYIKNATSVTLIFVAATSYNGFNKDPFKEGKDEVAICQKRLKLLDTKEYGDLYDSHVADYSALFGRVSLDLGDSDDSYKPIDKRIADYKPGMDPSLTSLYFQFGRYLLISSSRPGSQPANLQGIWNKDIQPVWSCNWTINCNTQINYWPVEVVNLSECHSPLFDMIREASVDGAKTAKNLYNSRGWMAHHNLDIWRTTWLVGGTGQWGLFQVGGAWLCQHIWEHYLFTLDEEFLHDYYDLLKNASLFFVDNLQMNQDGYLVTSPSVSFENAYVKPNGEHGWACMGASEDMQVIRALFENTMNAAEIVQDKSFKEELIKVYAKLAPMKISPKTGQLQEWYEDWEPGNLSNGQMGYGWAFAVGNQITLRGTPKLASAFRKAVEYRRPDYTYNSGSWTGAFPAVFWARFEEPDSVQRVIDRHFDQALFPNLTCNFGNSWQIDGNLGVTAAIAEMMLQSHAGEINLLPALPAKYPRGVVKGLRARGGYMIDIYWDDCKLIKAVIKADKIKKEEIISIRYGSNVREFRLVKDDVLVLDHFLNIQDKK